MGAIWILISLVAFIVLIFVVRLFGAWMLRIDEVIDLLTDIRNELKTGGDSIEAKAREYDAIEAFKKKLKEGK